MRANRPIDTDVQRRNVLEFKLDLVSDLTSRAIECPLSRFLSALRETRVPGPKPRRDASFRAKGRSSWPLTGEAIDGGRTGETGFVRLQQGGGHMTTEPSRFSVYSIRGLPAGVWGESYAIVTAFESAPNELTTESFLMTRRPKESLNCGTLRVAVGPLPPELGKIDLDFTLQEGLRETERLLVDLLEARAVELSSLDIAYLQFELKLTNTGDLLGCWMRGQFNSQIREIHAKTQCRPLARYLGLLFQVGTITRTG